MYFLDADGNRVELLALAEVPEPRAVAAADVLRDDSALGKAQRAFFELGLMRGATRPEAPPAAGPPPIAFRERDTGLLRTFRRELVLRFRPKTPEATRKAILAKLGLEIRRRNLYVADQLTVVDASRRRGGEVLLDLANECSGLPEVIFATPNFVSEYRRGASAIPAAQWHLANRGRVPGQSAHEDVHAPDAWKLTRGQRAIVVAVLDDGVDLEHPALKRNVWRNPKKNARDQVGRDFFLPDDHPDHFNPRPKLFRYPFDQMRGNDIHGTPCAGVVAAVGPKAFGVAPGCRILATKVFHADDLAADERVADAIRYAATIADVISCSWSGGISPDIQLALDDAQRIGRKGRGTPIFCATGNEAAGVAFPARDPRTIAVGASTDQGRLAEYSNTGPEVDVVAPSSGGILDIFTTDVSVAGRGFNVGVTEAGGKDGLYTNSFGGTSSATPLAAGIGALVLSVSPALTSADVRAVLRATADKIGSSYDSQGFSHDFGYGRVNAARAVNEAKARRP
jgi:subtilisin family serine protease